MKLNTIDSSTIDVSTTERDFRNAMNIIQYCLAHDSFPNMETLKDITNELLVHYDKHAFKLKPENQEMFIKIAKQVYDDDL